MINSVAPEISYACRVLFGPNIKISADFLHTLNFPALKSAFKKRALETHPDRARLLNQDATKLNERFKMVNEAYDRLYSLLDKKPDMPKAYSRSGSSHARPVSRPDHTSRFYHGPVPSWPLLLGRYLYYSGRISWSTLIAAITWQRSQRPSIGQMALKSGLLSEINIRRIIHYRKVGERFGECALRLGLLNSWQLTLLLRRQSDMQQPIGTYFITKGFLTSADLAQILKKQRIHNLQVASQKNR